MDEISSYFHKIESRLQWFKSAVISSDVEISSLFHRMVGISSLIQKMVEISSLFHEVEFRLR